eukprot:CAMPEP_0179191028 /NCGR_PEP_ID=MMETSP0796-20121207/94873_1 /TAXON_ID=73915 /ORGANISM="Pyrodinium bahamense, Strain pbaha01" /LENGTH=258 /DNA_ID=CAMNT_0020895235 /DNA_START=144 /DNA_END=920 /DNA_ORIENTATION=+
MAHVYKSSGCFPGQTAVSSVSQEDLKKLTYRTAYKHGTPGRMMSEEDKWENFSDVHGIGQKDTKYIRFQKNTAPLLDRSACSSTRDFIAKPLGDNQINAQLAESFKANTFTSKKGLDVSAQQNSCYSAEFVQYPTERMVSAKQKSFKPRQGRTQPLSSITHLMETHSASQLEYVPPHAELAKAAEILLMRPNLGLSGSWGSGPPKSSYGRDFNGGRVRRYGSEPQLVNLDLPEAPPELLPYDHPCFHVRRACHMSPGQ